jgi:hypothetical protein
MSHHNDHDHSHGHHHHHHHHHHTEAGSTLTAVEKAVKLLDHWIRHNDDHADTYREWADKLKAENLADAAALLDEAADINAEINKKFQQAADLIRKSG